jgi:acetoin utilization protein AcuB
MSRDPTALKPEESVLHAKLLMMRLGVRHLPVVDGDRLVGIVSDRDMRNYSPSYCTSLDVHELHYILDRLTVDEVMKRHPITTAPETPIEDAARMMLSYGIGCLPVVEGGRLVGIITETDMCRALIEEEESQRSGEGARRAPAGPGVEPGPQRPSVPPGRPG